MAAFEAPDGPLNGSGRCAVQVLTCTIRPRAFLKAGRNAFTTDSAPKTFTSNSRLMESSGSVFSKRGNSYLRKLFVQGARAVLQQSAKQSSGLSAWLAQLTTRLHSNVVALALANKMARMAWAVLAKNEPYRPPIVVGAATA